MSVRFFFILFYFFYFFKKQPFLTISDPTFLLGHQIPLLFIVFYFPLNISTPQQFLFFFLINNNNKTRQNSITD